MFIDEKIHLKRGLGLWERFGHPLDTLTVFVPMLFIALNPYTDNGHYIYLGLGIFSCLFITKDEWVHKNECSSFEQWIHSVLFVLHPIIFLSAGIIWKTDGNHFFLRMQPVFIGAFFLYQTLKWSFTWKEAK